MPVPALYGTIGPFFLHKGSRPKDQPKSIQKVHAALSSDPHRHLVHSSTDRSLHCPRVCHGSNSQMEWSSPMALIASRARKKTPLATSSLRRSGRHRTLRMTTNAYNSIYSWYLSMISTKHIYTYIFLYICIYIYISTSRFHG